MEGLTYDRCGKDLMYKQYHFDQYKLTFADCQIVSRGIVAGIRKIGSFDRDFEKVQEIERVLECPIGLTGTALFPLF
jgi:predicted nucleic-acid-binding protein